MNIKVCLTAFILFFLLTACSTAPQMQVTYDPATLRFDGERAMAIESEFVTRFPYRDSGMPNSRPSAEWIGQQMTRYGWTCTLDEWTVVNYSRPVPMRNMICRLPGVSAREIVVTAHQDQSPLAVQGADNDGSGIAIMLHLAELFGSEDKLPYTLVFVAADGEEYGSLGARRFVETHPDTSIIIAGFSLDQLGKRIFTGMDMDQRGQFRKFGPLWLQLLAAESARAGGVVWPVKVRALMDQVTGQAVPFSFMDEGPLVSAGVPAIGFTGLVPIEFKDLHWQTYHSPQDSLEYQSAASLHQSGRIVEAIIR